MWKFSGREALQGFAAAGTDKDLKNFQKINLQRSENMKMIF